ncbi:MerR family transcriptional regulator [Micromonospora rosaria]|uniref:MerR family transcriptional regulator n=1 Tax=Micromonospora rosaria TaxID=47874 RepID=A0A136PPP6_9ACTN|nr:MerR family transcriptional regulator [Micromonospora rosaria]KXK60338.1 MerR family transcriptional regulator [Micromonospora rosaria]
MRPIDLAREHGLSTQAVRNYTDAGILPVAERSPSGYRRYSPRHAHALRAFVALVPAHGHADATAIMQAVHRDRVDLALALVDRGHARLLADRQTLDAVEDALQGLDGADLSGGSPMSVGELARRLGVRPTTLRRWERAGVLRPPRDPGTGYRVYEAADVRDALLAHQLRRGTYPVEQIAEVLARVRAAGGVAPLRATLADWRTRLDRRGRAMLAAAAALDRYLTHTGR